MRSALVLALLLAPAAWAEPPATVAVDAREAPRGIYRAHLELPVQPGPLTLVYPKWLPGYHAPKGPITSLGGLVLSANGIRIPWRRDPVDMYAFHLTVPKGAARLEVELEVLASPHGEDGTQGLAQPRIATESALILEWHEVVMYPQGAASDALSYQASLMLPAGWRYATPLPVESVRAGEIRFAPVSLTALVDSTLDAGRYFQSIELGGTPAVRLNLVGDSAEAVAIPAERVAAYRALVREANALFGANHYRRYDFLWILSDAFMLDGIEHHEGSDNRSPEHVFQDEDVFRVEAALLPHEYSHSWNGKYRRPSGLATRNYQEPMHTELLWVYEGLTEYLGDMLAARSGLWTAEDHREEIARIAAELDTHRARRWRTLQDAADAAQLLYVQSWDWAARLRRQDDFYWESALLWLEADALIRSESHGARSLDDFLKLFHGGQGGAPTVLPYRFEDVCAALARVQPHDWRAFWRERLDRIGEHAPMDGIIASGWELTYSAAPNRLQKGHEAEDKNIDLRYSLGFIIGEDGKDLADVVPESPADRAGVAPGMRIVAVNGESFSRSVLEAALAAQLPMELLVENGHTLRRLALSYRDGPRNPHLVRREGAPDLLSEISRAKTAVIH
jgi:predicted metalloprotease with PDZ domain